MKHLLKDFIKTVLYCLACLIKYICPIRKGLVLCYSFNGKQYGGNVMYISDYLTQHTIFKVVWIKEKTSKAVFPEYIKIIDRQSFKKLLLINTAEFILSDNRIDSYAEFWSKRRGQKYIMMWHGGIGNKKIEGDAEDKLPPYYIKLAKKDSSLADLFISVSKFLSAQYQRAFWYKGEILKKGMPSYDIFYNKFIIEKNNVEVRQRLHIDKNALVVLYAPTFRKNHSITAYNIDWARIIDVLKQKEGKEVYVLLKLHPVFLCANIDISSLICHCHVINVTALGDIYPIMCASDFMISDYSASLFEFALLKRPGFIYANDYMDYDRGYYFDWDKLPFPFASNQTQLERNIKEFDASKYNIDRIDFYNNTLGLYEQKNATKEVVDWMFSHSL